VKSFYAASIKILTARRRLLLSFVLAFVAFLLLRGWLVAPTLLVAVWNAFMFGFLAPAWLEIAASDSGQTRRSAARQDSGRALIFFFVAAATCAGVFAVVFVLGMAKDLPRRELLAHLALTIAAVAGSWTLLHTTFTFHYARLFYGGAAATTEMREDGLIFPGEKQPDYSDFAYFSFVIGMTFQVSDVQIASSRIRRLALLHGVLSFVFNTMIVALSVNVFSGLLA
jgi:uncharacterized membrane protein